MVVILLKQGMNAPANGRLIVNHIVLYLMQHATVVLAGYWIGWLLRRPFTHIVAQPLYLQITAGLAATYIRKAISYSLKGAMQQLRSAKKPVWWLLLFVYVPIVYVRTTLANWKVLRLHPINISN